jgi:hypothetical protein
MKSNLNFKELWAKQITGQPDKADLLLKVKRMKKTHLRKVVFTNLMLVATSVFIICVWIYYQPRFLSTKIGIIITILAMVIFIVARHQSIPLLKRISDSQSNNEYLKNLLALKNKEQFLQTSILNLYFVMLALGIGLYLYEYASRMTLTGALLTYGLTAIWILFNWFYIRPRQIRKRQDRLNEIINKFEILNKQFDEEE